MLVEIFHGSLLGPNRFMRRRKSRLLKRELVRRSSLFWGPGGPYTVSECDHLPIVYRTAHVGRFIVRYRRCVLCRQTSKTVSLLPTVDELLASISHQWNSLAGESLRESDSMQ